MKPSTAIFAALGIACTTSVALADNERGLYLGGGVGQYNVKIDDVGDIGDTIGDYRSDDTAYKAFVGWRFNPFIAVEGAYVNLGSPDDTIAPGTTAETEIDGFAPYVVGTLPVGPIELFLKAGYLFYDVKSQVRSPLGTLSDEDSGEDLVYGGGVGFTLLEHLNLRLEYEKIDIKDTDRSDALWLTGAWRF